MTLPPLYAYRYRDPATGRWKRARQRATLADIKKQYAEWEPVIELDYRTGEAAVMNPFARVGYDEPPDMHPQLDADERTLAACFLRRYVAYCARRRAFVAMTNAASLLRSLAPPAIPTARPEPSPVPSRGA